MFRGLKGQILPKLKSKKMELLTPPDQCALLENKIKKITLNITMHFFLIYFPGPGRFNHISPKVLGLMWLNQSGPFLDIFEDG